MGRAHDWDPMNWAKEDDCWALASQEAMAQLEQVMFRKGITAKEMTHIKDRSIFVGMTQNAMWAAYSMITMIGTANFFLKTLYSAWIAALYHHLTAFTLPHNHS